MDKLIGQKFGRLTVLSKTDRTLQGAYLYECQCDCGNTTYQRRQALVSGHTKSCGCLQREVTAKISQDNVVDGTRPNLFNGKATKRSSTGLVGVSKYKQGEKIRYKASLKYKGQEYQKKGFRTAEEARDYRLHLEELYLPEELRQSL